MSAPINSAQMKRLQTLYGQLCAHTQQANSREARLRWAADLVGHDVASFGALTRDEARQLIDSVQAQLGLAPRRRRLDRRAAKRHGKDGRHDGAEFSAAPEMVSAEDLRTIEDFWTRLGWTRERFDAWLRSPTSPLRKTDPAIRTKADANRVRWALKGMLQARGLWDERKSA